MRNIYIRDVLACAGGIYIKNTFIKNACFAKSVYISNSYIENAYARSV